MKFISVASRYSGSTVFEEVYSNGPLQLTVFEINSKFSLVKF